MAQTVRAPITVTVLPASAPEGQMISFQDDMYVGCGAGTPLKRLSAADPIELIVTTATTSISFEGLDINKYQGYTLVSMIMSQNASYACYLHFNSMTTNASYVSQKMNATGSKQTDLKSSNAAFAETTSNYPTYAVTDVDIIDGYPVFMSRSIRKNTNDVSLFHGMLNVRQANINKLSITAANTNGIKAGSKFLLYRRA